MKTKERLAQAIHVLGFFNLEERARSGEFADFEGPHAFPKVVLMEALTDAVESLHQRGQKVQLEEVAKLIKRIAEGEFDDSDEEADAWASKRWSN